MHSVFILTSHDIVLNGNFFLEHTVYSFLTIYVIICQTQWTLHCALSSLFSYGNFLKLKFKSFEF